MAVRKKAKAKASTKATSTTNGRGDMNEFIKKTYPKVWASANALAVAFNDVAPADARPISGALRRLIAKRSNERRAESSNVRARARAEKLVAQEEAARKRLADIDAAKKLLASE